MKYYSTLRPIGPGTYPKPKGNFPANILNYADRTYIAEIGREAWGELEYLRPLSPQDVEDYELVPDPNQTEETR